MIDKQLIERELSDLVGLPLRSVERVLDMFMLKFGRLVEGEELIRNENGKIELRKREVGEYALHIQCFFRLSYQDTIRLAKKDLYSPTEKIKRLEKRKKKNFYYGDYGNNRMDEIIKNEFSDNLDDFVVERIVVKEFGDLEIYFRNEFVLAVLIDISEDSECWRFFKHSDIKSHLVINGKGIRGILMSLKEIN